MKSILFFITFNCFLSVFGKTVPETLEQLLHPNEDSCDDECDILHPTDDKNYVEPPVSQPQVLWQAQGQNLLRDKLNQRLNTNIAKNVIIFIGDGMGLSTQMASRVFMNDLDSELSFEKFPFSGLSKTYCTNRVVADSACTATAILTGEKNRMGVIGLKDNVRNGDCAAQRNENNHLNTIFKYAQDMGKATGIVTNTRITHATPAAAYATSASRSWESDAETPSACLDIAHQLIHGNVGRRFDVILGGGTRNFINTTMRDGNGNSGRRTDGRNLAQEYLTLRSQNNRRPVFVETGTALNEVNPATTDSLLGLFDPSHMLYRFEAQRRDQPSLLEMTRKAIQILEKNREGYVLLVEGGRIDHAHHSTRPQRSMTETLDFSETIEQIRSQINEENTLMVVTADHSHVFTVSGYATRGTNILSFAGNGDDGMRYFSLSYANGPGHPNHVAPTGGRADPANMDFMQESFRYPATVPLSSETHGGEDVGVYAIGPFAHLFSGVYEQSFIGHALMYASCLGPKHFLKPPQCPRQ